FVMTHPHDDHVGGAAALIAQLAPDDVRDAAFAGTSPSYREALVTARDAGVPWRRIHPGDSLDVDGVMATFLAPDSTWTAALSDPNLASAVVRVRYGAFRALLTGDAEAPEEAWLLARDPAALRADVLKVAHHGSATSTTPAWLDAVAPSVALVSVGAGNRYRHPSPAVIADLFAHGARVARTDLLGTVVVRTDRTGGTFVVEARGAIVYRGRAASPVAP
ncbi:MAG: MBL fold metallo-hydrolase, partial [Gemmatimonadota bacterium]|nr:MBL fold metallo-hydrolase [Gemmatimonadota bacterium]